MDWRWNARRLLISTFLVFHVGGTLVWVLPQCPIKTLVTPWSQYYFMPLGIWQFWAMFAPDPQRNTLQLEAEVIDAQGLRHAFAFPRLADYSSWRGVPRFRYSKYAVNLTTDELAPAREFAARHVLRQLKLPADAYPVSVHLYYQVRTPPPPGELPDLMKPTTPTSFATFDFSSPPEVRP